MFSCWNFLTLQIKSEVNENKITLSWTVILVPSPSRHLVGLHQPHSTSLPPLLWTESGTILWQAKRRAHGGHHSFLWPPLWSLRNQSCSPQLSYPRNHSAAVMRHTSKWPSALALWKCPLSAVGITLVDLRCSGPSAPSIWEQDTIRKSFCGP